VHAQFIAVDANFRLKLKNRQINDPELGSGWSYFVENSAYTRHVAKNPHEKEVGRVPNIQKYIYSNASLGRELWK
jgi:hypothetical protein